MSAMGGADSYSRDPLEFMEHRSSADADLPREQAELPANGPDGPRSSKRRSDSSFLAIDLTQRYALVAVWALVVAVFGVLRTSTFLTGQNFLNIFGSQAGQVILTIGLVAVLSGGELDLSIAGNLGLGASIVATLNAVQHVNVVIAVVVALLATTVAGCVNALIVVKFGIESIIVTLGMGTFLDGISLGVTHQNTIGGISATAVNFINYTMLGLPVAFYLALLVVLMASYVHHFTPYGRHVIFIGENREAARLAGLPVARIRASTFVVSGFLAGLAGVVVALEASGFQASSADSFLLPTFAGVFLGAACVEPGRFNPLGSFIAIYFLVTGVNGLEVMGYSGFVQDLFYGAFLIIAVGISTASRNSLAGALVRKRIGQLRVREAEADPTS